jgi:hypothetical protein
MGCIGKNGDYIAAFIQNDISYHQVKGTGIDVSGEHDPSPGGDRDRERPYPGEHIQNKLPLVHDLQNSLPFIREPGGKIGGTEIDVEP